MWAIDTSRVLRGNTKFNQDTENCKTIYNYNNHLDHLSEGCITFIMSFCILFLCNYSVEVFKFKTLSFSLTKKVNYDKCHFCVD